VRHLQGAPEIFSELGVIPAGVLFFLDLLKAVLPLLVVLPMGASLWIKFANLDGGYDFPAFIPWAVGLAVVIGHCFSPWDYIHSGKGATVCLGIAALLSPWAAIVGVVVFSVAFMSKGSWTLARLFAVLTGLVAHLVLNPLAFHLIGALGVVFVVILKHEKEIDSLLSAEKA
jgi:glycerol-3-phosphate acyltransferase PlsY